MTVDYNLFTSINTSKEERKRLNVGDIYKNQAQCRQCGDLIRSKNRHDLVTCKCGEISVDGGSWDLNRSAKNISNVIEKSILFKDAEVGE